MYSISGGEEQEAGSGIETEGKAILEREFGEGLLEEG